MVIGDGHSDKQTQLPRILTETSRKHLMTTPPVSMAVQIFILFFLCIIINVVNAFFLFTINFVRHLM